jgi:hypothetical protein
VQILILPDGRLRPDEYEFEMEGVRGPAHEDGASHNAPAPQPVARIAPAHAENPKRSSPKTGGGSRDRRPSPPPAAAAAAAPESSDE